MGLNIQWQDHFNLCPWKHIERNICHGFFIITFLLIDNKIVMVIDFVPSDSWVTSTLHITSRTVSRCPHFPRCPLHFELSLKTQGNASFQHIGGASQVLRFQLLPVKQSLANSNWIRRQSPQRSRKQVQFYEKDYAAQQGQTPRWFVFLSLVFLFNQQKRLLSVAGIMTGHIRPESNMLQSAKSAADCSALQSSQNSRICVAVFPVIARIPNWGCSLKGAFEGKNNESFSCFRIDCPSTSAALGT